MISHHAALALLKPAEPAYRGQVDEWWSIEISGAEHDISMWIGARGRDVIRTALEHGARDWDWVSGTWGVVLEFCFADSVAAAGGWTDFIDYPLVKAALDAVPDPVKGLFFYPGRGGSSPAAVPRRPKPAPVAAAAALPEPETPTEPARLAATATVSPYAAAVSPYGEKAGAAGGRVSGGFYDAAFC
jgi:hypothetical protein